MKEACDGGSHSSAHTGDGAPGLLHEFFERVARRWPEYLAIDVPPSPARRPRRTVTYAQLDRQATALAAVLRESVAGECVVAILLPRNSEHLYLAQLAVLKAGAAHACLDPSFPDEQIRDILADAGAVALLTDAAGVERVQRVQPELTRLLDVIAWAESIPEGVVALEPAPWLTPRSLAYVIYTSGTTGQPKGVMIEHGSIANLVAGDLETLGITPADRCGQSASPAYDSSVEETWFALAAGATLVVMDDETTRLGPDLVEWLRRERLTLFAPTPSLLRAIGGEPPERDLPDLRVVHVGGEMLPADLAERWARGRRLVNDYGPTETTVTALRGVIAPGEPVTIGRPVPGAQAWVLDAQLEEVAVGREGELCIGGAGLARGYMNDPEMTARKFPRHPRLGRIYRTGDLVRCNADGRYSCLGRIDAQVKIRGYRIELEAIESRLGECAGVRAAACRVQGEGAQAKIVAFVVPADPAAPPDLGALRQALRQTLPAYMVPSFLGLLPALPTTLSGKLNRRVLPRLEIEPPELAGAGPGPRSALEEKLAAGFQRVLRRSTTVAMDDDFFRTLGGDSLLAAELISLLRGDPATAALTVRDLYEAPTVAELAQRVPPAAETKRAVTVEAGPPAGRPMLATLAQAAWLALGLLAGAPFVYALAFHLLPALGEKLGLLPLLLLAPLLYFAGLIAYTVGVVGCAVAAKRLLIGRYRPLEAPVWGSFQVRNWMVQQTVRLIPWRWLEGTVFQQKVLRLLGARIGRRVHIHRGVDLTQGGWDLLEIGDDVTLSQDAALRLVELEAGRILVGPVRLEDSVTLEVRASLAGHTWVGAGAELAALSYLPAGGKIPAGERWDGVPAGPAGKAERGGVSKPVMPPPWHGGAMVLARLALEAWVALPLEALAYFFARGLEPGWWFEPTFDPATVLHGILLALATVPLVLSFQVLALRAMGRVETGVINRWSLAYIRVWLKTGIVESASRWLAGSLLWPVWLRLAGMRVGRGCEIGTLIDTVPEMVEIDDETFFADGVYLAGPRVRRGVVTLAPVRLGRNTFLGNHALVAGGQNLPGDVLVGICTAADDRLMRAGTSWFGHPPFELPRREVVEFDRSLTHDPTWWRWQSRLNWELARVTLPLAPVGLGLVWLALLMRAAPAVPRPWLIFGVVPALELGFLAGLCLIVLAAKWLLLGRVRPGKHPLYSSWCSRWDFLYVVWDFLGQRPLTALEGTLLLNGYLRAMGMKIGRGVVLGRGFAHVVDPDMLEFADGATVNCQLQAHTFEDRVLKIDRVRVGRGASVGNLAVLLYGADIGDNTRVSPHSVVMKRERLLPDHAYAGCPTRLWRV